MGNALSTILERLKDLKKESKNSNKMDEVFFYDPYEKKMSDFTKEMVEQTLNNMHEAIKRSAIKTEEAARRINYAMRHMGKRSGI